MSRVLVLAVLLFAAGAAGANARAWNFRVFLDEREIGRHSFTLRESGEERELKSEARFDVRLLFVSAYRYEHEATERWRGGCLRSLVARTYDNGARDAVDWRGGQESCAMSFAYWDPRILQAERLLNAQTGEFVPVRVSPQGEETIEVRGRPTAAQRYRLSGPSLEIDLWFAGSQWVALESSAPGGRRLRYRLQ